MGSSASKGSTANGFNLNSIQQLVLQQYPFLSNIKESMLIADCSLPDMPIIHANDNFEKMTFYPKEEIIGRNCRFLQGSHTNQATIQGIRKAISTSRPIEVEILNYRKDGVAFWNNFLMLPVFKKKKCRYFIAIQKNITTIKKDNKPDEWTPAELAMWLEFYGLKQFTQRIIAHAIDGKSFLAITASELFKYGVLMRYEVDDLLKASLHLNQNFEIPFHPIGDPAPYEDQNNGDMISHGLLVSYVAEVSPEGTNFDIDVQSPTELHYWDTETTLINTIMFKAYYGQSIYLFEWPKPTLSIEVIENAICSHFEIKNASLSITRDGKTPERNIYTQNDFEEAMETEEGTTIKFLVKKEKKDFLSLAPILASLPEAIIIVNQFLMILFSNEAANKLCKISGTVRMPNANQLFPELPLDFPKYPEINTIITIDKKSVPVSLSVASRSSTVFMFIIRPLFRSSLPFVTHSFKQIEQQMKSKNTLLQPLSTSTLTPEDELDVLEPVTEPVIDPAYESLSTPTLLAPISPAQVNNPSTLSRDNQSECPSTSDTSLSSLSQETEYGTTAVIVEEGSQKTLARTMDELLSQGNSVSVKYFLSSFKLYHSKENVVTELRNIVDYYFTSVTDDGQDFIANLSSTIDILLAEWFSLYPQDFKTGKFRTQFIAILESLPKSQRGNTTKLTLIKGSSKDFQGFQGDFIDKISFTSPLLDHASANDIANAITLQDRILFERIDVKEFYKCAWTKNEKLLLAPTLTMIAQRFEKITQWISSCVLVPSIRNRTKRIQMLIAVAQKMLRLNNFHGMMAVLSGLDLVAVSRLKKTWKRISEPSRAMLEEMRCFMEYKNNFTRYRSTLHVLQEDSSVFAVPYLPMILRDITYAYEYATKDLTPESMEILGKQVSVVHSFQSSSRALPHFIHCER